jgi:SAM-dependent methyltransferase
MGDSLYARTLKRLSAKSRRQKFELLQMVFKPTEQDRVLDVGASGELFTEYTFEDFYPFPCRIIGGGVDFWEVLKAQRRYPGPAYVTFDGCALPFADKSFDLVFSNAVIEHIPEAQRQREFAREVMRVGKSWFVTTPNYWFPFEPHYHLPLIQFLPREGQRLYNRLLGGSIPKGEVQQLALLSARRLRSLFPGSVVVRMRVTFWPETLVAYRIDPARTNSRRELACGGASDGA